MSNQLASAFLTDEVVRESLKVGEKFEEAAVATSVAPAAVAVGMRAPRVLVADDNRDAAVSLALLLGLSGSETTTAFDGEEALSVASDFDPDLILLDIDMPKLNGFEVCRLLRLRPRPQPVVIFALTGWGSDDDRRKSADAGFDAHFVKPLEPGVVQVILNWLGALNVG